MLPVHNVLIVPVKKKRQKKTVFSPFFVGPFTQPFHTRLPTAVTVRNIDFELSLWGTIQQQTQTICGSTFTPYLAILKFKISVFTHFGHIWSLKNLISSLNTVKMITFVMFILKIPQNLIFD